MADLKRFEKRYSVVPVRDGKPLEVDIVDLDRHFWTRRGAINDAIEMNSVASILHASHNYAVFDRKLEVFIAEWDKF